MNLRTLARLVIAAIAVISIGAGFLVKDLKFDYDFERFFPTGDPDLEFYLDFRDKFSTDNDFFLIGIGNEAGVFEPGFLQQVADLTDTLQQLKYVVEVSSPTNITNPVAGPFGLMQVPYVHPDDPERRQADSVRVYANEHLVGTHFSKDGKAICLNVAHKQYISKAGSDSLLIAIEGVLANYRFDNMHTAGRIKGQAHYIEKMEWEMKVFVSASIVLLILFLWVSFRTAWGIYLPIIIVLLAALWLLALMYITGKDLDLMGSLLPTILFVVGMSDVVHFLSKYLEELRFGKPKVEALKISVREIGLATFLTSLTTSIGFLTLMTASIAPVREFGIYTAIGVALAYILAFTLFPAALMLMPTPKIASQQMAKVFWWRRLMNLFSWVINHKALILAGGAAVIVLSLVGISRIKVDNFLLEDLRPGDPLLADFTYFETEFSGVRPFEMAVWMADTSRTLMDPAVQQEFQEVENYLVANYGVDFIVSPATVVKSANKALNGGSSEAFRLPETDREWAKTSTIVKQIAKTGKLDMFMTHDADTGRISGKVTDYGGYEMKIRNAALDSFMQAEVDSTLIGYRITGTAMLIDKNNEYLANNMLTGLLIAFGIIALIAGLLFRSITMVFISLVPNVLPLLMMGGIMGFSGIDLKVSTSIIFTIAFGIAVDDTIHFISKLKLELNKGRTQPLALKRTFISTGKAIIVTTIILCSGFITLILSTFTSTFYIGVLISLALAFAVIADLLLLPVLLLTFYKHKTPPRDVATMRASTAPEKQVETEN